MPNQIPPDPAAYYAETQRRFIALEAKLDERTATTEKLSADTQELLDLFRTAKGGFRVIGWIGSTFKWLAGLLAAFAAIYAFVQNVKGQ